MDKVITFNMNREGLLILIPTHFDRNTICSISSIFMAAARRASACLSSPYNGRSKLSVSAGQGGALLYKAMVSTVFCVLLASLDPG